MCSQVGFVASFVSKFSDTVSSEIGKVSAGFLALRLTLESVTTHTRTFVATFVEGCIMLDAVMAVLLWSKPRYRPDVALTVSNWCIGSFHQHDTAQPQVACQAIYTDKLAIRLQVMVLQHRLMARQHT